jgi:hypothetical protein
MNGVCWDVLRCAALLVLLQVGKPCSASFEDSVGSLILIVDNFQRASVFI